MAREDDFNMADEMVPFELTSNANTQRKDCEEDGVSPNAIVVVEQVDDTVA